MREIRVNEVNRRFGRLVDASRRAPVFLTRSGRAVGVILAVEQFNRLHGAAWRACKKPHCPPGEEEQHTRPA